MRIKRGGAIAIIMAVVMVLSACSSEPSNTPFKLDMMFLSKPKIVLAVEEGILERSNIGTAAFAKKVSDMSKGDMVVEVLSTKDPIGQLKARTADMAYVSTDSLTPHTKLFEMMEAPFYFRDYTHMTMTLNSRSFRDLVEDDISEKLGAELLATVFSDASIMLTVEDYIGDLNEIDDIKIAMQNNNLCTDLLRSVGANIDVMAEKEMTEGFNSGEIKNIECKISEMQSVQKPLDEDFFYITESFHNMELEWLLVSDEYMNTQNNSQKAVIRDAAAVILATLDKERLDLYDDELDRLLVNGGEITRYSPDSIKKKAKELMSATKGASSDLGWNMELYDAVQSIIR